MNINIEKRQVYFLIGAILIIAGIVAVTAFGTNNPSVFGHSPGEIGPGTFGGTNNDLWAFPGSIRADGTSIEGRYIVSTGGATIKGGLDVGEAGGDLFIHPNNGIVLGGERRTSWPSPNGWECNIKQSEYTSGAGSNTGISQVCDQGYRVISGGCEIESGSGTGDQDITVTRPTDDNGWFCQASRVDRKIKAFALCCK
jgi:hypothetical protein